MKYRFLVAPELKLDPGRSSLQTFHYLASVSGLCFVFSHRYARLK
jgi:hypothetical protein